MASRFGTVRMVVLGGVCVALAGLTGCALGPSPKPALDQALQAVRQAGSAGAGQFAPQTLRKARTTLRDANAAASNGDATAARRKAETARARADLARARARVGRAQADTARARHQLRLMQNRLTHARQADQ